MKLAQVRPAAEAVAQHWFDQIGTLPQQLLTDKLSVF